MSLFGIPKFAVHSNTTTSAPNATVNTSLNDLVVSMWAGQNSPTGVTDTIGNTYIVTGLPAQNGFGAFEFFAYCLSSIGTNPSNVVSWAFGAAISGIVSVWSVPSGGASVTFDAQAKQISNGAANPAVVAMNTTGSDEIVFVGVCSVTTGVAYTPGGGFTLSNNGTLAPGITSQATEFGTFASPQTGITPGFTALSSDYAIIACAFKASGLGPIAKVFRIVDFSAGVKTVTSPAISVHTGDLVVVGTFGPGGPSPPNLVLSDTIGNSYTPISPDGVNPGAGTHATLNYVVSTGTNAANVVSATWLTANAMAIVVFVVPRTPGAVVSLDTSAFFGGLAVANVATSSSYTTTGVDDLAFVVAGVDLSNTVTFTAGTNFILDGSINNTTSTSVGFEHQAYSSAQAGVTATINTSTATPQVGMAVGVFKSVGGSIPGSGGKAPWVSPLINSSIEKGNA